MPLWHIRRVVDWRHFVGRQVPSATLKSVGIGNCARASSDALNDCSNGRRDTGRLFCIIIIN